MRGARRAFLNQPWAVDLQDLDPKLFDLLSEQGVTDVLIDGARDCWIDRGRGLEARPNPFESESQATTAALKLASHDSVRLDLAKPFADVVAARQGSGLAVRIHLVLASEICERTQICIRVLSERPVPLDQLVRVGMISSEQVAAIRQMLEKRQNFLISGATGSGKTTLLRAIASEFAAERIITIEDIPELRLEANSLQLITRANNQEGRGAITADDLLIQSLRMRPDRILLGELRGPELASLLRVLNTGHSGVGATVHANSAATVWNRLRGMAQLGGMTSSAIEAAAIGVLDWVIHCEKLNGVRKVTSISRLSKGTSDLAASPISESLAAESLAAESLPAEVVPAPSTGRRRRLEVI